MSIKRRMGQNLPPELWPKMVMRLGSPPKYSMFSCTHSKASLWSFRPTLSESSASSSSFKANPKAKRLINMYPSNKSSQEPNSPFNL